jgi:hypothetical protein
LIYQLIEYEKVLFKSRRDIVEEEEEEEDEDEEGERPGRSTMNINDGLMAEEYKGERVDVSAAEDAEEAKPTSERMECEEGELEMRRQQREHEEEVEDPDSEMVDLEHDRNHPTPTRVYSHNPLDSHPRLPTTSPAFALPRLFLPPLPASNRLPASGPPVAGDDLPVHIDDVE